MEYKEALDYIHSLGVFGSRPGLERIRELCRRLGDPQEKIKFIHIAGTNGKGSVCAMLSSVLRRSGLKVGLYTSPYISFFEERIRINGEPISKTRLAETLQKVKSVADSMNEEITEFEIITAVAFVYFFEEKCDVVVLETGLGGRLDATNIIKAPLLSVITGIAMDHTSVLGDTLEKIAAEKGGIIKRGCPVVSADMPAGAKGVLRNIAADLSAPLYEVDYGRVTDKSFSLDGTAFTMEPYGKINLSLSGVYQADNAAVCITAAEVLKNAGFRVSAKHIKEGLLRARWQARFEILSRSPLIIYDGAHNAQGAAALRENIERILGKKAVLLTGVMADKDYCLIAEILAPVLKEVFTVTPDNPRSLNSKDLAKVFSSLGVKATAFDDMKKGFCLAKSVAEKSGLPLIISGTLYMYNSISDLL